MKAKTLVTTQLVAGVLVIFALARHVLANRELYGEAIISTLNTGRRIVINAVIISIVDFSGNVMMCSVDMKYGDVLISLTISKTNIY